MKQSRLMAAALAALSLAACSSDKQAENDLGLNPEKFVVTIDGKQTGLYTLKNEAGMKVAITNYGGRIVSLLVPDRDGNMQDVVLGFDSVAAYFPENNKTDFGAAIGRYANRINQGHLEIDGETFQLPQNNFGHCLHGGPTGWQYKVYDVVQSNDSVLKMQIVSPDGDNDFPGTVTATVTYTLHADNSLALSYEATTDKPTVVNLTNHSYFNLNGNPEEPITNCKLQINASRFTPVDSTFMTSGEIISVKDTPMDFTTERVIGEGIDDVSYEQIKNGNGYDHNWVLDTNGDLTAEAARLSSPLTGIVLTVFTDEPGIQVYSGNFLDGTNVGKRGIAYQQRTGICLETQHYPDSPNKADWPSVILRPGQTYRSYTLFRFTTEK